MPRTRTKNSNLARMRRLTAFAALAFAKGLTVLAIASCFWSIKIIWIQIGPTPTYYYQTFACQNRTGVWLEHGVLKAGTRSDWLNDRNPDERAASERKTGILHLGLNIQADRNFSNLSLTIKRTAGRMISIESGENELSLPGLRLRPNGETIPDPPPAPSYQVVTMPAALLISATLGLGISLIAPDARAYRRRSLGLCSKCGYDLRASPHLCPECGSPHVQKFKGSTC